MRDFRINLIFEGSSEIMRLFIAREAVDTHFSLAFDLVRPDATMGQRVAALGRSIPFYAAWYPARWLSALVPRGYREFGVLAPHLRFAHRATNRLGRSLFHAMLRFGPKLERRQMVLFRAVDIGADLYAMTAACVRARLLASRGQPEAMDLADAFCRDARVRIARNFAQLYGRHDPALYRLAQDVLQGKHAWVEQGILGTGPAPAGSHGAAAQAAPAREPAGVH